MKNLFNKAINTISNVAELRKAVPELCAEGLLNVCKGNRSLATVTYVSMVAIQTTSNVLVSRALKKRGYKKTAQILDTLILTRSMIQIDVHANTIKAIYTYNYK